MGSVYKVIEIIGSSKESWEDAARNAVELMSESVEEIRIAEVKELDMKVDRGNIVEYRTKLNVSFKHDKRRLLEDRVALLTGQKP